MERGRARLQLIEQATTVVGAADEGPPEPALAPVVATGPDDGRLAHRATHRRDVPVPSRHEAEGLLVGFVADLLDAPDGASGRVVAGPEEAAMAVLRGARDSRPGLRVATVVLPASAHPAYFSAAATLGLLPLVAPLDADGRASVGASTRLMREDTVLVIASAPSYTHGVVDPVAWLAAAAAVRGLPLHVDATGGGWAVAHAERAGRVGPGWGFAATGVTSVALSVGPESGGVADLAVLLHRDSAGARAAAPTAVRRRGPLDLPATWSRPGGLLGDVVETLQEIGHDGCADLVDDALGATAALVAGVEALDGVRLVARPAATVVSLRTDATCDVLTLADALHRRGWTTHPVLPESGPPLLRVPVTAAVRPVVGQLLEALAEAVEEARERGPAQVDATLARLLEHLDPDGVRDSSAHLLLDAAATLDAVVTEHPGARAETNLLLAAAQPGVREALLGVHLDRLVRPVRTGQDPATTASTEARE